MINSDELLLWSRLEWMVPTIFANKIFFEMYFQILSSTWKLCHMFCSLLQFFSNHFWGICRIRWYTCTLSTLQISIVYLKVFLQPMSEQLMRVIVSENKSLINQSWLYESIWKGYRAAAIIAIIETKNWHYFKLLLDF